MNTDKFPYKRGDRVLYFGGSDGVQWATVTQDRDGFTYVYLELDNERGVSQSVADTTISLPIL